MPRHHKYRLPGPRRGGGGGFFLRVLILLVAGVGLWVWWQSRQAAPMAPPARPVAPLTNPPVIPTVTPPEPPTSAPAPSVLPPTAAALLPPERGTSPPAIQPTIPPPPGIFPRTARDTLEAQVALARQTISPGSIDGVLGSQTRAAMLAFQQSSGISQTPEADAVTRARLVLETPPLRTYIVTPNDLARLQPLSQTWLGKSRQSALDYETLLELVAEQGRASPTLIRRLNPTMDWSDVAVGTEVQIPDVTYPEPRERAGFAVIRLGEKRLQVFDARTNLLAHFPCSIAARVEKRPAGELRVTALAPNPNYTFDPDVFPESAEARELKRKLILPPGPNNPVGTAWISLSKPGYGLHGTPHPEQVGRTESHGCFRLANWNAEYMLKLAWVGMPVYVEP